jgi:hypothetical protein
MQSENEQSARPDPIDLIVKWLADWTAKRRLTLPEPCPRGLKDCALWWTRQMQEPERPGETYEVTRNGKTGWSEGYAVRCAHALLTFIDLPEADRQFVLGGIQDRVPYRGDKIEFYRSVYSETMRMREIGVEKYRKEAIAKMKRFLGAAQIHSTEGGS